jgi:prolyl 4-hydroxylase
VIEEYLSSEECASIIEMARNKLRPSTVWNVLKGESVVSDYRNSEQGWFRFHGNELVTLLERRLSENFKIPEENGEDLQVVHYNIGGYYKSHHDFFEPDVGRNDVELAKGGQRTLTVLMYLNTVEEGGATFFDKLDLRIKPKTGRAVVWHNITNEGKVDHNTLHTAEPVSKGEKWIMTKWFRERKIR